MTPHPPRGDLAETLDELDAEQRAYRTAALVAVARLLNLASGDRDCVTVVAALAPLSRLDVAFSAAQDAAYRVVVRTTDGPQGCNPVRR